MEGVKQLSRLYLEKKALEILSQYDSQYLITIRSNWILFDKKILDIEDLIESFYDLEIDYKNLSIDGNILGLTSFCKNVIPVFSDEDNKLELIKVNEGNIIIDSKLLEIGNEGRIRFTLAHEIAHWILHKELFSGCYAKRKEKYLVSNDTEQGLLTLDVYYKTDEEWIEWQADYLAGALLMPYVLFSYYFDIIRRELDIKQNYLYLDKQMCNIKNCNYAINKLSNIFGTSKLATKVRMYKLGFLKQEQ